MRQKLIILAALIGICGFFIYLSCCDDCPTCPGDPEPPPLGNYRVYVFDGLNKFLMSVDTPADTIVDSIRLDFNGYACFITPDGERLLATNQNNNTMSIYNTSDLSFVGSNPRYGEYFFDGTDNYGICMSFLDNKMYFIDPLTLAPLDSIDRMGYESYLDTVNDIYYISADYIIYRVNCNSRVLQDSLILPYPATGEILYNRLANDICYITHDQLFSYFFQYDIEKDSIVSTTYITGNGGSISISPDGRYIYMTDSGHGMFNETPPGYIYVFDAINHEIIKLIPNYDFIANRWVRPYLGEIRLSSDNRRAYIGAGVSAGGGVPLVIIDLIENKIVKTISPYSAFEATGIVLGPIPN